MEPLGPMVLDPGVPILHGVELFLVVAPLSVIAIQLPWLLSPVGAD